MAEQQGYRVTDRSKAITALTVKQLEGATQNGSSDPWVVDGVELTFGRIVGRILDLQDDHTTCRILLHDGTGSIQFTHYVEQSDAWSTKRGAMECVPAPASAQPPQPLLLRQRRPHPLAPSLPSTSANPPSPHTHPVRSKGKYLDVVFEVKGNAARDCPPLTFNLVTDPNRITRHLLEVVYGHLHNTRGPLAAPPGAGGAQGGAAGSGSPSGMYGGGAGMAGGALGVGGGTDRAAEITSENTAVLDIYKENEEEDGMTLQEAIFKGKQRGISERAVREATITLQMDGHIYSTVDENHFKCVPCGGGVWWGWGSSTRACLRAHLSLTLTPLSLPRLLLAPSQGYHGIMGGADVCGWVSGAYFYSFLWVCFV